MAKKAGRLIVNHQILTLMVALKISAKKAKRLLKIKNTAQATTKAK